MSPDCFVTYVLDRSWLVFDSAARQDPAVFISENKGFCFVIFV